MSKVVFIRHGKTDWANQFTGWRDEADITTDGLEQTRFFASRLKEEKIDFDICFTSMLRRAIRTGLVVMDVLNQLWIPHFKAWQLNERHYGALQGMNKKQAVDEYGDEQVNVWRRSYDVPPPLLSENDPTHPKNDRKYKNVDPHLLPSGECLADVQKRTFPYWKTVIFPEIINGKNILISGNHNAMRSILMELDQMSPLEVENLNIPYSIPLIYEFDDKGKVISKRYLADKSEIEESINLIKNQTK